MWEEEQAEVPRRLKPFLDCGIFMLRGLGLYIGFSFLCFRTSYLFPMGRRLCSALFMPGIFLARRLPPPLVESSNCGHWFCGLGQTALWGALFDVIIFSTLFGGLYVACRRLWAGKSVD